LPTGFRSDYQPFLVLITGMGGAATERALAWTLGEHSPAGRPKLVVSAGFCGALVGDLCVGDTILPDEVMESEGRIWAIAASNFHHEAVEGHISVGAPVSAKPQAAESHQVRSATTRPVRLLTVSAPILTAEQRLAFHARSGAIVVDMESANAARCCADVGVPFLSLRAVSDGLDAIVPTDLSAAVCGEEVSLLKLACAVVHRPSLVVELARLARQSRVAARSLAGGLTDLLNRGVTSR
jgi:nucleoside phosphorylase